MEILALYTSPDALDSALAAGARHLAASVEGLALIYRVGAHAEEPDGWAGFTCAGDAQLAGSELDAFRKRIEYAERPLRSEPPGEQERIWQRASGGLWGFPLRRGNRSLGVAIVGCPGAWPRVRNAEVESVLQQLALVLEHHYMTDSTPTGEEPSDELLRLSEQLLAQDLELIDKDEKLSEVEQLKNDLIERMSHELRSPLNSIIERIISVLAGEHESLSESGRLGLRQALDSGNALLRTLQNILDLWRLRQGEVKVEVHDVNLYEVIEEAIFNIRDSLRPDVEFEQRLPKSLPKVRTDLGKLNQILFHVLDNAAKFTLVGRIELEVSLEEGQLLCNVNDTGIGVAPDDQSQIFDEFFQVDASTDNGYPGAGLGLTLARSLVEMLGGAMSVSSEIGRGTRMSFTLPLQPA
jgi:signal transduction histidine kinase